MSKSTFPVGDSRTTREPRISVIRSPPSGSGVSPFGDPYVYGARSAQTPDRPKVLTIRLDGAISMIRQFLMSATTRFPFARG